MNGLERPLAETLDLIARDCRDLLDPWWLIGSAAALLLGLDGPVKDIDLLTSRRDAPSLMNRWGVAPIRPEPSALFHSEIFALRRDTPVPIELMAGFAVRGKPLVPETRVRVERPDGALFVPDLGEQIAICLRFGRAKDVARAERLRAMLRAKEKPRREPGLFGRS